MKKTIQILFIVAVSLFLSSCENKTEKKEKSIKETSVEKIVEEKHQKAENEVQLNNGKRWEANPETTKGIKKMLIIVKGFSEVNENSYTELKANLEKEFADVFAKCTMKGEAHNQLHNYLKPMLDMFDGLESEDINIKKESVKTLYKHLSQYGNYFE